MEKKQFLWDFCPLFGGNSELFPTRFTKRGKKHQKVFFYTNLGLKGTSNGNSGLNARFVLTKHHKRLRSCHRGLRERWHN